MSEIEKIARAIATGLGDNFDHAFASKREWIDARGEKAGRLRDINEPRQGDYIEAAIAAVKAMREPTERLSYVGGTAFEDAAFGEGKLVFDGAADAWRAMIDAILTPPGGTP